MWGGDRDLKMKEAAAMGGGVLNLKMEAVAIGGADPDLMSNEASRPWEEEGGILKLKKEMNAAFHLWLRTKALFWNDKEALEKLQALGAGKKNKKTKVVKSPYPKGLIDHMAACPFTIFADLPDEQLAKYPPEFEKIYTTAKLYEAKTREYWNALIDQQEKVGYAQDEIEVEVTDDEEEVVN